jgi:sugar/nucleoside kinase (ribokinase family)
MRYDICCVGHMCTDILAKPVDALPEKGKLLLIDTVKMQTGGCAMNTSIGLAKLGARVCLTGKVGGDGFGAYMKAALEEHGVGTEGLLMEPGGMSSVSVVTIGTDAERTILHSLGTNELLCYDDINLDTVLNSRYLFIGGVFLLPRFDGPDAARLLKEAQEHGVVTAMDTAWDSTGRWLKLIEPCLAHLDWFMPSVEEAEQMLGLRDPAELAAGFKRLGVKNVAIKLGSAGCYLEPAGEAGMFFPAFSVEVADTAGAGDAWCAGFLSALARGLALHECAIWGNAVGSLCVTQVGTTNGILDMDGTARFIRERIDSLGIHPAAQPDAGGEA